MTTSQQIQQSIQSIRSKTDFIPDVGIILGTGLGRLADEVENVAIVPYSEIANFPVPTVESHRGRLIFGHLSGKKVAVMQGRFHYYEGYDLPEVTLPVRVLRALGIGTLIVSNAAGGVNPQFRSGDIVAITDHINLTGHNPLRGPNDDSLGPRFPDMFEVYSPRLVDIAETVALSLGIPLRRGVYAWVTGPNLETAAEYRYIRTIGADMVGMSTVPEVIVARHCGLTVAGFSVITDMGLPDALHAVDLQEVLRVAAAAEPKLTKLIAAMVGRL